MLAQPALANNAEAEPLQGQNLPVFYTSPTAKLKGRILALLWQGTATGGSDFLDPKLASLLHLPDREIEGSNFGPTLARRLTDHTSIRVLLVSSLTLHN